ncbi:MAG TPA: ElyC/SanA/YdcF family protein [Nevskiaceae bacterium]
MISRGAFHRVVRRWIFILLGIAIVVVWLLNHWVINSTKAYVYSSWSLLPDNRVGLVLGTSPYTRGGQENPQFIGRVDAAAQLYQLGKVRQLLVSGANPGPNYNEPRMMRAALLRRGVPARAITMDLSGDRTLDSVARADVVFGLHRFTIITQRYHAYRAEFLAKKLHLEAIVYAAPGGAELGPLSRTRIREVLARIKAVLDIYVLDTQPRYGGDRRPIPAPAPPSGAGVVPRGGQQAFSETEGPPAARPAGLGNHGEGA